MALSPLMQQYFEIKKEHPECILMTRIGDFYEMFFDDAKLVSRELELVLTGKDCGLEERAPMCGVPFHAAEQYIARLVAKGYRVAICEQMEDPATAKGLVKRDIIRIITPGTVTEPGCLDEKRNNFICSLYYGGEGYGVVFADISTGALNVTEIPDSEDNLLVYSEAASFMPSECIVNKAVSGDIRTYFSEKFGSLITPADETVFTEENVASRIASQFEDKTVNPSSLSAYALVSLLRYLEATQKIDLSYLKTVSLYSADKYLSVDISSRRNLELCRSMRTGEKKGTLLWVLDKTLTSAGTRLITRWIEKPLVNVKEIRDRQSVIRELSASPVTLGELRENLRAVSDIERLITRLIYGTANARDMISLRNSAEVFPNIQKLLKTLNSPLAVGLSDDFDTLDDIHESILKTVADEPPVSLREGNIIRDGASKAVDELRLMLHDGKSFISRIEQAEKERTGIRTLKVGYNKVFGYYIEVSNSFLDQVPEDYIRRQTLVNGERFVTQELKETEARVITAGDRDAELEYEIFGELREFILKSKERIIKSAEIISVIDVLCSLALVASESAYVCPEVDYSNVLYIKDGRHPVVEKFTKEKYFVPNDCDMNTESKRTMLITGPNMAGKSTYMRQVALITIMAQIGSFVPASEARIGVADKIFTRVGASDDLSSGDSTFMLEMKEVAYILKNATSRSLVIYDEIGRGTSTYDGMSIARAVLEYTNKKIGAKTLFATHYHELTELEGEITGVRNYNIAAKKRGSDIIFLRKIVEGGTDDSYGIEVARLAGVPKDVLNRARDILKELSEKLPTAPRVTEAENDNVSFEDITESRVTEKLRGTDINTITPIEALTLLYELKNMLK